MHRLINRLRQLHFEIHVITASCDVVASFAVPWLFAIPASCVHGVRQIVDSGSLTGHLLEPVTIGQGKADYYHQFISAQSPMITASDSTMDMPLLNLCDPAGIALWLGSHADFEALRTRTNLSHQLCFVGAGVETTEERGKESEVRSQKSECRDRNLLRPRQ
jgi:hypothetical protein